MWVTLDYIKSLGAIAHFNQSVGNRWHIFIDRWEKANEQHEIWQKVEEDNYGDDEDDGGGGDGTYEENDYDNNKDAGAAANEDGDDDDEEEDDEDVYDNNSDDGGGDDDVQWLAVVDKANADTEQAARKEEVNIGEEGNEESEVFPKVTLCSAPSAH